MWASGGRQVLHAGEPGAQHGLPRYASSQRSLRSRHSLRSWGRSGARRPRDETHQRWPPQTEMRRAGSTPPPDHAPEVASACSPLADRSSPEHDGQRGPRRRGPQPCQSRSGASAEAETPQRSTRKQDAKKKLTTHMPRTTESGSCLTNRSWRGRRRGRGARLTREPRPQSRCIRDALRPRGTTGGAGHPKNGPMSPISFRRQPEGPSGEPQSGLI